MSSNEVPYSTQMSGISVIYLTGLDKVYLSPNQIKKLQSCKEKRIDCNIRFDLTERPNNTIKLREKQVDEIKKCKREKKKYCDIKFSSTQIGGFLPALIPAALAVAKALGLGAAGYAGTKLAQKAFGLWRWYKKNKKNTKNPKTYGQGIKLIGKRG
jgi:hypothetical protein